MDTGKTAPISLSKWISLASTHERCEGEVVDADGDIVEAFTAKRAVQLAYIERAAKVALLILGCLQNGLAPLTDDGSSQRSTCILCEDDIKTENFIVLIELDDTISGHTSANPKNGHIDLSMPIISNGSVTGIEFSDCIKHKSIDQDLIISDAYMQRIGFLLYELFCRGEKPFSFRELEPNGHKIGNCHGDSSRDISHKRVNTSAEMPFERYLFANDNVPPSICRLISDLMNSGAKEIENPFESVGAIAAEIMQIIEAPRIFLHPAGTKPEALHFGGEVYGRTTELHSFLQVAARATMANETHEKHLILIGGPSGSGKSFLVENIKHPLSNSGFQPISAKFDRLMRQQPLSAICSAFDEYFASIADPGEDDVYVHEIVTAMEQELSSIGIVDLSNLIPSMRNLFPNIMQRVVRDPDLSSLNPDLSNISDVDERTVEQEPSGRLNVISDEQEHMSASNAESSRNRLHYLFRKLVHSVSSREHPLLLFLDDLQWADHSSLDLISSLLLDFDHLDPLHNDNNIQHFLVVASFRDDEVDENNDLTQRLEIFDASNSVNVRKISLGPMPKECCNLMISNALKLPMRFTRSLADVVMAKSLGNPLYVKEFVRSLFYEKILHWSMVTRCWVWDIKAVKAVSMDGNVAQLLTRKILYLSSSSQEAIKVASCIGSKINEIVLQSLSQSEEWANLEDGLNDAVNEKMLERDRDLYRFTHDMVQQASYELMSEEDCRGYHYKIGMQLMRCLPASEEFGPIAFEAIGQINRAQIFIGLESQATFAELNLKAGLKSIEVGDFGSALMYLEHGIKFLPQDTSWESYYKLSLCLHENASLCCFVLALMEKMKSFLKEVFVHAVCLEDKLKSYYMLCRSLASFGKNLHEATEKVLGLLRALGEDFPDPEELTPDLIKKELVSSKAMLNELTKEKILSSQQMTDVTKIWTLRFLALFILYLFHSYPKYLPLASARILKISMESGFSSDSAFGFIGMGNVLTSLVQDIDTGYRLGKTALLLPASLNTKESRTRVKFYYYMLFAYWKEPIQANIVSLQENEKECLAVGDNEYAGLSMFCRCRVSFCAGENLAFVEAATSSAVSQLARLQQLNIHIAMTLHHITVLELIGHDYSACDMFGGALPVKTEDQLLMWAINVGKTPIIRMIYQSRMIRSFWFKRYDEAVKLAAQHDNSRMHGFFDVIHVFYEGISLFHCARSQPNDPQTMQLAEQTSLSRFRNWAQHSTWNFQNRLALLEAEWHFTKGEMEKAEGMFNLSIELAQKHRFLHEEGLAHQLLSEFYTVNGNAVKANLHNSEAIAKYGRWGAHAVVALLDQPKIQTS